VNLESDEMEKLMAHVDKDYHGAFKKMLLYSKDEFRPHNTSYIVYGTMILWAAWLFFNGGSQNNVFAFRTNSPAKIIINTWLSGSIAGIVAVYVKPHILKSYSFVNRFDCTTLCNGILCGLVGVTGCCDQVDSWSAFMIGIVSAFAYILGCWFMEKVHVDDAVEAFPIHLFGGIWGTIATGLFSNVKGVFFGAERSWTFLGY
jgi:Amt family ammonium transporter